MSKDINSRFGFNMYKYPIWPNNGKTVAKESETELSFITGSQDYAFLCDLAIDANGILHATYRLGTGHNTANDGDIIYRRSLNTSGTSWDSQVIVKAHGGNMATNPCIFFIGVRLHIIYIYAGDWMLIYSDDNGETWSGEVFWINYYIGGGGNGQLSGASQAIEHNGKVLKAMYGTTLNSGERQGYLYESTGLDLSSSPPFTFKSFITKPLTTPEAYDWEEPSLIRRSDGLIMGAVRSDPKKEIHTIYTLNGGTLFSHARKWLADSWMKIGWAVSPSGTGMFIGRNKADARAVLIYSNDYFRNGISGGYCDSRTGEAEYAGTVWSPQEGKFICLRSTEIGTPDTGPTILLCERYIES